MLKGRSISVSVTCKGQAPSFCWCGSSRLNDQVLNLALYCYAHEHTGKGLKKIRIVYNRYRNLATVSNPTDIVLLVVFYRLRYKLSLRDLAEMFLERGFSFTHEAVRDWEERFAPLIADHL